MELVGDFFKVASKMLNEEGQVHVSHRDDYPSGYGELRILQMMLSLFSKRRRCLVNVTTLVTVTKEVRGFK